MELLQGLKNSGHEQVVFFQQADSGLRCMIALHSTVLGPALGGLRMWPYASEADALRDVLRHSREMTYKCALAGLNLGGGKAVLLGHPEREKNGAWFRSSCRPTTRWSSPSLRSRIRKSRWLPSTCSTCSCPTRLRGTASGRG